ncbi:hypothetical protein Tco_0173235 [Tanacetum coccineum]
MNNFSKDGMNSGTAMTGVLGGYTVNAEVGILELRSQPFSFIFIMGPKYCLGSDFLWSKGCKEGSPSGVSGGQS